VARREAVFPALPRSHARPGGGPITLSSGRLPGGGWGKIEGGPALAGVTGLEREPSAGRPPNTAFRGAMPGAPCHRPRPAPAPAKTSVAGGVDVGKSRADGLQVALRSGPRHPPAIQPRPIAITLKPSRTL